MNSLQRQLCLIPLLDVQLTFFNSALVNCVEVLRLHTASSQKLSLSATCTADTNHE